MKKVVLTLVMFTSCSVATPAFAATFRLPPIDTLRMFHVPQVYRLRDQGYRRPATNILNFTFPTFSFMRNRTELWTKK